ncbi:MAG: hypothetical protein H3C47_04620 [Candidatus Cloacimonetes bacterium]|nr:hypothetical protein [Candidatus Cloacimonadota bacterium]
MSFRQAVILDIVLISVPLIFLFQLPFFYGELKRASRVESSQGTQTTQQFVRRATDKGNILKVDPFRVKRVEKPVVAAPVVKPVEQAAPPPPPPPPVMSLPLELTGTIVAGDRSVAFINNTRDRSSGAYIKGDEILPGIRVMSIELRKVILDNRGIRQELIEAGYSDALAKLLSGTILDSGTVAATADTPPPPPSNLPAGQFEVTQQGNSVYVTQNEVKRQVQNLSTLLSQVRVQPNIGPSGRADGFKVLHVNPRSFIESVGIRSGDVIKSINGEVVDSMQKGYEIFNRIRNDVSLDVVVERGGQTVPLRYEMRY